MTRIILLCLALQGLCGSAYSQAPAPASAQQNYATIYLYQKGSFGRSIFDIWMNERRVVENFRPRSYFVIQVMPGSLRLRTTGQPAYFVEEKNFRLQVHSGQTYYLEAVMDYDFMSSSLYLVERKAEDFQQRMKALKRDERAQTTLE